MNDKEILQKMKETFAELTQKTQELIKNTERMVNASIHTMNAQEFVRIMNKNRELSEQVQELTDTFKNSIIE